MKKYSLPYSSAATSSLLNAYNQPADFHASAYYGEYACDCEPILHRLNSKNIVTVNRMNCQVLNSETLGIIDVDLAGTCCCPECGLKPTAIEALELLDNAANLTGLAFRVYRTRGGFRYLCTTKPLKPEEKTFALMESVEADPRYISLCRELKSFRARLSPKPLGIQSAPQSAVCRYVGRIGDAPVHHLLRRAVEYHDLATKAHTASLSLV